MFQRFADARTALVSGDIQLTAFGPQDISLALARARSSWSAWRASAEATTAWSCARARTSRTGRIARRQGDRRRRRVDLLAQVRRLGPGERRSQYNKLKIVNIVGGGANYLRRLQSKEIDMAVVWQPFCAQAIVDGFGAYPTMDHNRSKTVGGLIAVLGVNRAFMEKNRDAVPALVIAYVDVLEHCAQGHGGAGRAFTPRRRACPRTWRPRRSAPPSSTRRCRSSRSSASRSSCPTTASSRATCRARIARALRLRFLAKATGKSPEQLGLKQ